MKSLKIIPMFQEIELEFYIFLLFMKSGVLLSLPHPGQELKIVSKWHGFTKVITGVQDKNNAYQ
jgi:hypothetical protein